MSDAAAETFNHMRPRLTRVAYRMLGSVADAEDVVQDAFVRFWLNADHGTVREPEAFLRRVVTRLCLDELKSARRRRLSYVGPWLPEPVIEEQEDEADDVTLPLLMALERLSPGERAAFLLHDVFGLGFDEIAQTIERSVTACRQLASRARTRVRASRPRHDLPRAHGLEIARAFFTASRHGDMAALRSLLSADVTLYSDGGGKRPSATVPIIGLEAVMAGQVLLTTIYAKGFSKALRFGFINGLPGFVSVESDGLPQTTAFAIEEGKITAMYVQRNPDKLRGVQQGLN
ncbi:MAG: sigma-70 family RNA polymerase sigma factor [Mesorhizobium sp.]